MPTPGPVSRWIEPKIHAATEASAFQSDLIGSLGQRSDITFAHDLIGGFEAVAALAGKGYDADHPC